MEEQNKQQNAQPGTAPVHNNAPSGSAPGANVNTHGGGGFQRPRNPRQGGRRGGPGGRRSRFGGRMEKPEYEQHTLDIARVVRVTKGGKRFSFRATLAIGNGKGKIGVGLAKGKDVAQAIQKAFNRAKRDMITVPIVNGSIPHQAEAKFHAAVVVIKPSRGGVKAGGPVRILARLAGITRLTGKLIGRTSNKANVARATMEAFKKLKVKHEAKNIKAEVVDVKSETKT